MINYSIKELTVSIGSFDASPFLLELTIGLPLAEIQSPQTWSGSFRLTSKTVEPPSQSLDQIQNANLRPGAQPVIISYDGTKVATLRIKSYKYDPFRGEGEGTLTDVLDFHNRSKLSAEILPVGRRSLPQIFSACLAAAGCGASVAYPGFPAWVNYDAPIFSDRPIQTAIDLALSAGYTPWVDQDEVIQFLQYHTGSPAIVLALPYSLTDPQPGDLGISEIEAVPKEVVVSGTKEVIVQRSKEPSVYEEYKIIPGSGVFPYLSKRVTRLREGQGFVLPIGEIGTQTTTERAISDVFTLVDGAGTPYFVWSSFAAERLLETYRYDSEGYLVRKTSTYDRAAGIKFPENFENQTWTVSGCDVIEEAWTRDPVTGVTAEHRITERQKYVDPSNGFAILPDLLITRLEIERWEREGLDLSAYNPTDVVPQPEQRYTYTKELWLREQAPDDPATAETGADSQLPDLILQPSDPPQEDSVPPAPPTRAPESPLQSVPISGSAKVRPNGWQIQGDEVLQVSLDWLPHPEAAQTLATTIAAQIFQRLDSRRFRLPILPELIQGFRPWRGAAIGDAVWVIDSPQFVWVEGVAAIEFVGNRIGSIAPISDPVEAVTPLNLTGELTISPVPDQVFFVGLPSQIQLNATGGTQPYSFSVPGLPAGLTLSGSVISGSPNALGTTTVTATVTDGASATASDSFQIQVLSVPVAEPAYGQLFEVFSPVVATPVVRSSLLSIVQTQQVLSPQPVVSLIDVGVPSEFEWFARVDTSSGSKPYRLRLFRFDSAPSFGWDGSTATSTYTSPVYSEDPTPNPPDWLHDQILAGGTGIYIIAIVATATDDVLFGSFSVSPFSDPSLGAHNTNSGHTSGNPTYQFEVLSVVPGSESIVISTYRPF